MMPPTSIDGTDITGATIDGQDVQEITVDGQTVFTAQSPVLDTTIFNNAASYFKMSTGSGTTLFDSVGSNDATVSSLSWGSGDGLEDAYADFSSNISGPFSGSASDWSGLVNNAEGSVGFFINPNSTSVFGSIIGENIGPGLMWAFKVNNGNVQFNGHTGSGDLWNVSTSISSGSWQSVVGTVDSSTNTAKLYIDAVEEASDSTSTSSGNLYRDVAIGAEHSRSRRFFDGEIDSLFYSDTHSTQSDITEWHDAHDGLYP